MVSATDFSCDMLLLAIQISHESGMEHLLLVVLDALLETNYLKDDETSHTDAMTVIRCSIRLIIKLLSRPDASL